MAEGPGEIASTEPSAALEGQVKTTWVVTKDAESISGKFGQSRVESVLALSLTHSTAPVEDLVLDGLRVEDDQVAKLNTKGRLTTKDICSAVVPLTWSLNCSKDGERNVSSTKAGSM